MRISLPPALPERIKRALPKSLFGRALLILVLPTILLQILAITIFYDRHWSSIQRHLSLSLAGEVSVVVERAYRSEAHERDDNIAFYGQQMHMDIEIIPLPLATFPEQEKERFARYVAELERKIDLPFIVYQPPDKRLIRTQVALPEGVVQIDVGIKRLESSTTYIFVMWVVGSAALLLVIAIVFLRNQIRPIRRLAQAAQRFGTGQDVSTFRPHGAEEVRKAGHAFLVMRSRIMRQVSTRTAMLTGISHDLRTPLTRLKLQLEMLNPCEEVRAMQEDVHDMEHMLGEYLDFARGNDESIPSDMTDMAEWLRDVIQAYAVTQAPITYTLPESVSLPIRHNQMKRALQNIIGNALKYGEHCHVSTEVNEGWLSIIIDDDGPGIPHDAMEEVFRPFTRLDDSRNSDTGGVGLGLAITRDIIQTHGGHIRVQNITDEYNEIKGLSVIVLLPIP